MQDKFAKTLGCNAKFIQTRLIALGHSTVCGRCGGSGHYSFNLMHGTTCFGCSGSGKVATKLSEKLLATVTVQIANGELEPYLKATKERIERKAKIKGMMDRLFASWGNQPTVRAEKEAKIFWINQSARHNSINHFCSDLIDEATKLVRLVSEGEWSKEYRRYVPIAAGEQAKAVERLLEIERLIGNSETLAPDLEWSKEKNSFVAVAVAV